MYKSRVVPYLFIVPAFLFLAVFLIYPFLKNIVDSFFEYEHALDPSPDFVGFNNYIGLFKDTMFLHSLKNTALLILAVIVFQVGIALVLALLVNSVKKLKTFYKVTFFMPIIISATALGLMFNMFFQKDGGMFNQILDLFNIKPVTWIDVTNLPKLFAVLSFPVIWQYIGFYFVIFLTGLSTIPDELLDAAEVDGANGFKKVFKIQLPLLQNITKVVLILSITGTLKVFELPYIMNPYGRPSGKSHFLGTYMYYKAFINNTNLGFAAAIAVILVILGVVLSSVCNLVFKTRDDI